MTLLLKIETLRPQCLPERMTANSVGLDVRASEDINFLPDETNLVPLGFKMQIPIGYWAMLVPRSSLHKKNLIMVNSIGVIDQDYRLEVKMPLRNIGLISRTIEQYERIGQIILMPMLPIEIQSGIVEETSRGGFGSTNT